MKVRSAYDKRGLAFIELLIALVLFGIVVAGIYRLFVAQNMAYVVQDQVVEVQQNIRSAMEVLLRDLRMAGYDDDSLPSKTAGIEISTPIAIFSNNSITVDYEYYDTNAAQYQRHRVLYSLNAGNINRQIDRFLAASVLINSTTETLLGNVDNLTFTYGVDVDKDGNVDNWVSAGGVGKSPIIAVRVTLTARPTQDNPDVQKIVLPRTLTSAITLRNLCLVKL